MSSGMSAIEGIMTLWEGLLVWALFPRNFWPCLHLMFSSNTYVRNLPADVNTFMTPALFLCDWGAGQTDKK